MTVAVVGGGLAGLVAAYEVAAAGHDVAVFEATSRVGGVIETVSEHGFLLEGGGASLLLPDPAVGSLFERIGVEMVPAQGTHARYLATDDELVPLPTSPPDMLSFPLIGAAGKIRAMGELFVPSTSPPGDDVLSFCRRRFGAEAGHLLGHVMATGVFAGDPSRLEVVSAFPRLADIDGSIIKAIWGGRRAPRRKLHVPRRGMGAVIDRLEEEIPAVEYSAPVDTLRRSGEGWEVGVAGQRHRFESLVLAVPPPVVERLLPDLPVPRLEHVDVAVVGLGGPDVPAVEGFGALRHPDAGLLSAGILFESSYTTGRAPQGSAMVRVIAGGSMRPDVATMNDDEIVEAVAAELTLLTGAPCVPSWRKVLRRRIPQYGAGFGRSRAALAARVDDDGRLAVTGWGLDGVGLASVIAGARRAAAEVTGA